MKRYLIGVFLTAILLWGWGTASVASPSEEANSAFDFLSQEPTARSDYRPGQILLKFRAEVPELVAADILRARGLTIAGELGDLKVLRVAVPEGLEEALVESLSQDPRVEYAELDYLAHATLIPNDKYYSSQWAPGKIQAPSAWDIAVGSSEVIIAVLDTGVDLNHPDLGSKIVAGWNFVQPGEGPQDDHGHGTHVAGIAAAETNNGVGVAGISSGARIMPVKVLNAQGDGYYSDVAAGVAWACDHGASIINMSLGGVEFSATLHEAIEQAYDDGCLLAAAAGNEGGNQVLYPARDSATIAVAATDQSDGRASFSNYGSQIDVAAPGVSIYSTLWDDTYGYMQGTSMATPHVAGLAALVWSVDSGLTNAEVQGIIEATTDDFGYPGWDPYYGFGRINAFGAVEAAVATRHTVSTPNTPAGSSCGQLEQSWTYSTGGAVDSEGHAVQYRLDWGDGVYTSWSASTTVSHTWSSPGIYTLKAQARCSVDTSVTSPWSAGATVTIVAPTQTADPDLMVFLADDTNGPWPQTLIVGNDSLCGSLSWDAVASESWVVLQPGLGVASWSDPGEVTVYVNKTDPVLKPGGTYTATITVSSNTPGVQGSPQVVGVQFVYSASPLERTFLPLALRN